MTSNNPTWEKTPELAAQLRPRFGQRQVYMLIAGVGILAVVSYLLYSVLFGGHYYTSVDELLADPDLVGKNVRVTGVIIGDYQYDSSTETLTFVIGHIPTDGDAIKDEGGLATTLANAVNDPETTRLTVVYPSGEIPDLLENGNQAIITGKLDENGVFYADNLTLKCPTKYADELPQQAASPE
jgi:cytochrome c-type biogenesis protein CcmE